VSIPWNRAQIEAWGVDGKAVYVRRRRIVANGKAYVQPEIVGTWPPRTEGIREAVLRRLPKRGVR